MSSKEKDKLLHDINSAISSLNQAFDVALSNLDTNLDLVKNVLNLARKKGESLAADWAELKENIRGK